MKRTVGLVFSFLCLLMLSACTCEHDWVKAEGNLADVLPGRMIGGDVFENRKHKLPEAPGRIWFEADFDYTGGYRNSFRLLYSNDGLIFVTYDHYATFYEIDTEGE